MGNDVALMAGQSTTITWAYGSASSSSTSSSDYGFSGLSALGTSNGEFTVTLGEKSGAMTQLFSGVVCFFALLALAAF